MGHGHGEPFEVPHYSIYNNYRQFPHIAEHERRLARLGLKDNFIRNYAFKFDPKNKLIKKELSFFGLLMRQGLFTGLGIGIGIIAIEEGYSYFRYGYTSWNPEH